MMKDDYRNAAAEVFRHFERRGASHKPATIIVEWILNVFCWDGLLPIAVVGIPTLVQFLLPNWQVLFGILFLICPVTALSIRFVIGWQRMRSGRSYYWQMLLFTIAVSALFLFEAFILNDQMVQGPKIADPQVLLTMFAVYLSMMAIALFPFRALLEMRSG